MTLVNSIALAIVAALVGTYLQYRLWRHKRDEEIRERELHDATQTIEKISILFGQRLFAHREFFERFNAGRATQDDYEKFIRAVSEWINNFYFLRSQVKRLFGNDAAHQFEYELHDILQKTYAIIKRTWKYKYENLSQEHQREHDSLPNLHLIAAREVSRLLQNLNEIVDNSEFGTQSNRNNIEVGDLDQISTLFLVQRLFNVR